MNLCELPSDTGVASSWFLWTSRSRSLVALAIAGDQAQTELPGPLPVAI